MCDGSLNFGYAIFKPWIGSVLRNKAGGAKPVRFPRRTKVDVMAVRQQLAVVSPFSCRSSFFMPYYFDLQCNLKSFVHCFVIRSETNSSRNLNGFLLRLGTSITAVCSTFCPFGKKWFIKACALSIWAPWVFLLGVSLCRSSLSVHGQKSIIQFLVETR